MNFLNDNLSVISRRWPKIAQEIQQAHFDSKQVELIKDQELSLVFDNIQIASSYNQLAEANIQISTLAENAENITLYGTGLGVVQSQLIKRAQVKSITIVVLNLSLFKACLSYFDQQYWLLNSKVSLTLPLAKAKVSSPFIALPAELALATNSSAALRDRVCLSLDDEFINKYRGIDNLELQQKITSNLDYIENDHDISELFAVKDKADYIICGAGPTLAEHYQFLKQAAEKGNYTIIAVDAAVIPLVQAGIIPDIIVSIDPVAKKLFDDFALEQCKKVPLVYFPLGSVELLACWQGPRYTAYSTGKLYNAICELHPKGRLYCGGSVMHPSVDLAVKMGAKKVYLFGADFSFPDGKTHTHWQVDEYSDAIKRESSHWVLNGMNERVPTLLNYRGYLRDLEDFIALATDVEFFNSSQKGALIAGTKIMSITE